MTTGSITRGFVYNVSTNAGPGKVYEGYFEKTWSGNDSVFTKDSSPTAYRGSPRYARVMTPDGYQLIKLRPRLVPPKKGPSREQDLRENSYNCTISTKTDRVIQYLYKPSGVWRTGTGLNTGFGNYTTSGSWDSNDDLALIGKLRTEIAGSDFNLAVTLAEGREAFSMITSAATRIYGAYTAARRGDLVKAARILTNNTPHRRIADKTVASNWLELQYGWLPLINDAYGAAQYLAEYALNRRVRVYRARMSKRLGIGPAVPFAKGEGEYIARGQLIAKLTEVNEARLSGLADPLSVAWELLPYSFVIDWFLPVGDYLSARALSRAVTGTFVTTKTTKLMWRALPFNSPDYRVNSIDTVLMNVEVRRTVSSNLSVPTPRIVPMGQALSFKRAANAVALLLQLRPTGSR